MAYAVGLVATDGNLATGTRRVSLVSKDVEQLQTFLRCVKLDATIRRARAGSGRFYYPVQCAHGRLYDWLVRIGLTPAKSATLGVLDIPREYFRDFVRGYIDGDGSITTYADRSHTFKNPTYVYTRLYVSLVSASPRFLEWICRAVRVLTGATDSMTVRRAAGKRDLWQLRYAKADSLRLLRWMYYAPDVPSLTRKRVVAEKFLLAVPISRPLGPAGRW